MGLRSFYHALVGPTPGEVKAAAVLYSDPHHDSLCRCADASSGRFCACVGSVPSVNGPQCYCCGSTADLRMPATGAEGGPVCLRCSQAKYPDALYEPARWHERS